MIKQIIDNIVTALKNNGITEVYNSFDALPLSCKSSGFFTIADIGGFECGRPIYSQYTIFMPFKSEIKLSVTAPEDSRLDRLYTYFGTEIEPVLLSMSDLDCRLSKVSVKHDSNIHRLVLTASFSVCGVDRMERSEP